MKSETTLLSRAVLLEGAVPTLSSRVLHRASVGRGLNSLLKLPRASCFTLCCIPHLIRAQKAAVTSESGVDGGLNAVEVVGRQQVLIRWQQL